jgi:Uma2 family endonuclease
MAVQRTGVKVDEFERFLHLPENSAKHFELINGKITEKVVTREHGIIAGLIITEFNLYLRQNRIGRAAVEARHRPASDDENDRLPDVSVVCDLDKPVEREGAALYMPDLAVEIKSPDDTYKQMREKARFYLAHGTRMVWLVFPEKKLVEVYTPDEEQILTEGDSLTGGEVLPGFSLSVHAISDLYSSC